MNTFAIHDKRQGTISIVTTNGSLPCSCVNSFRNIVVLVECFIIKEQRILFAVYGNYLIIQCADMFTRN